MQLGGVFCICSNLAGLTEVVCDRGILIDNFGVDDGFIQAVTNLYNGKINKSTYLEKGFNWAIKQDWKLKALETYHLI
jgi:hypothetical protein